MINFTSKNILVFGDLMVDEYIIGDKYRISDEAPVPILQVDEFKTLLGGAANVAHNVRSLGNNAILCGIIGVGYSGDRFIRLLQDNNIGDDTVVQDKSCWTTTKSRVVIRRQQMVRYDYEMTTIQDEVLEKLAQKILMIDFNKVDVIIVSDYCKGLSVPNLINILKLHNIPIVVDTKYMHRDLYTNIFCMTPNLREFSQMVDCVFDKPYNGLENKAREFISSHNIQNIVIKLGEQGVFYCDKDISGFVDSLQVEVLNTIGAGDTFVATLSAAIANGLGLSESVKIANIAAGIVVSKRYIRTCTVEEILSFT